MDADPASWLEAELPAARVVERADPLTLEPEKIDLLGPLLLVW